MLDKTSAIATLNAYSFDAIWNSTQAERRVNIALDFVASRMQTSSITFRRTVVGLPTTELGMVYYAPFDLLCVRSSRVQSNTWYDLTKFLNITQTRLCMYDATGHMIPMSQAWVYVFEASNELIIFVPKRGLRDIPGGYDSPMFLTGYYNPLLNNPMTAWSYRLNADATTRATQVMQLRSDISKLDAAKVTLIQNGIEVDASATLTFAGDDCIDLLFDDGVMASFVVNIDTNTTGYNSTLYNGYREIVHFPKSANPNNWIVTHDAVTMYVRDQDSNRGVYLHRLGDTCVEQVTHNDISIDRMLLNALMAALGTSNISVRVMLHTPYNPHALPMDVSLIQDLYLCDDDDIVQHLRGAIDPVNLPFWQASQLEASEFLTMMFKSTAITDDTVMSQYLGGLGYFGVSNALGLNSYTGTYVGSEMVITKPFVLRNVDAIPLVFVNGRKVHQQMIAYGALNASQLVVDIAPGSVNVGDTVNILLYTDTQIKPLAFTPSDARPFITVADQDYTLYQMVNVEETPGYKTSSTVGYRETAIDGTLIKYIANADGTYDLAFDRTLFQNTYILLPTTFMYGVSYLLDDFISTPEPMVFPLRTITDTGVSLPVLRQDSVDVFVNGYALIKDIDYTLTPEVDNTGALIFTDLVLTNRSFLDVKSGGNQLEVFVHTDQTLSIDTGYAYSGILARTNRPSVWFPGIGAAYVNGRLVTGLTDYGAWLTSSTVVDGSVFCLKTVVPSGLSDILETADETSELTTIKAIDTYLGRNTPTSPPIMAVKTQHQLYSPYLMAIISDICDGTFSAVYDANRDTFMAQFSGYNYLKDRDPTLNQNGLIDRRFCSVSASFVQYKPTTVLAARIIQTLIAAVGIETDATLGDTYV